MLGALKRMDYKGEMTRHGFRGLASTVLNEKGYECAQIEMRLAHAPNNEAEQRIARPYTYRNVAS